MKISGFTFIHNALDGGYPIVEAMDAVLSWVDELVVIDAQSNDGTLDLLFRYARSRDWDKILIVDGPWGDQAGETLANLHAMHQGNCSGDVIVHFEADEVFDPRLAEYLIAHVRMGSMPPDVKVLRLQVEQNFQRIRWYPEPVHRVFPRGTVKKVGHTTNRSAEVQTVAPPGWGFLWDVTNCFRDNWIGRLDQQSQLRGGEPLNNLAVPLHTGHPATMGDVSQWSDFFKLPHWLWGVTPLAIPDNLKHLVGQTRYEPEIDRPLVKWGSEPGVYHDATL